MNEVSLYSLGLCEKKIYTLTDTGCHQVTYLGGKKFSGMTREVKGKSRKRFSHFQGDTSKTGPSCL